MKYTGKIRVLGFVWISFLVGGCYLYWAEASVHWSAVAATMGVYTLAGWWLGKRYDQLRYLSMRDSLTQSYNRRYVYTMFPKLKQQADRQKHILTVYVIDVNDFKRINDTFGHAAGDLTLRIIAKTLNRLCKPGDIVARWGGDEFIMISSHKAESLHSIHNRMREENMTDLPAAIAPYVSVSIGKAMYPTESKQLDELIKIADSNMYELKQEKKNIV